MKQTSRKHRYLMPLDDAMRGSIAAMAQNYPKRVASDTGDTFTPNERGRFDSDRHAPACIA